MTNRRRSSTNDLGTVSLDEVMDWPSVWNPENPGYQRMWGMIRATIEKRGVVEGHGSGLIDPHDLSAFAAAGIASDHEVWALEEAWERLSRGIFTELRPFSYDVILPGLIERLEDWSNVAFTTDDRSATETLEKGASDYNVRLAIEHGLSPEIAIQCATLNPARHMRIDRWVGSVTPGRYADIVLLDDVADPLHPPRLCRWQADVGRQDLPRPASSRSTGPTGRRKTMNIGRRLSAADFAIPAAPGRDTMQAAVLRPFHWNEDFLVETLPVADGEVQRDTARMITKWALVDRYRGDGAVAKMFWTGCGPADPDTAIACSVAHDSHNVWSVGSSDEAMALAVNRLQEIDGGWVLVHRGAIVAEVRFEIGGLMTARPAEAFDEEMQAFYRAAEKVDWMYRPSALNLWKPGFPEFLKFATLTCSPWRWVLVAPSAAAPNGFVNVQTGEQHEVVW